MVWLFKSSRISVAVALLPASVLFGRVTSSLKFEILLLDAFKKFSLCVLKFDRALLVRITCDVFEIA